MNENIQWEADRYVLDDPTLDRTAFEDRMLEDTELALAVAEAVKRIQLIRDMDLCAKPTAPEFDSVSIQLDNDVQSDHDSKGWHWSSLAALAAALLLMIGLAAGTVNRWRSWQSTQAVNSTGQSEVAEHWLVMLSESTGSLDVADLLGDEVNDLPSLSETDDEARDWMMDAAREFYSERAAS